MNMDELDDADDLVRGAGIESHDYKILEAGNGILSLLSVLQCVAVVAVCCSVLRCVAVCCSVLGIESHGYTILEAGNGMLRLLQCVAVCCCVLQCVAVCCSVLQCVAVCCSV